MFRFTSAYEDEPALSLYTGLARVLWGNERAFCRYGGLSSLDAAALVIELPDVYRTMERGARATLERAEVYLRAGGSARMTDFAALERARGEVQACGAPRLGWQWLLTAEDARLMVHLCRERPRLAPLFARRMAYHRRRVRRQAAWRAGRSGQTASAERVYLELLDELQALFRQPDSGVLTSDTELAVSWAAERLLEAIAKGPTDDLNETWFDLRWRPSADGVPGDASHLSSRSRSAFCGREETEKATGQRVDLWTRPHDGARGALLEGPANAGARAAARAHAGRLAEDLVDDVGRTVLSRAAGAPRRRQVRAEDEGHLEVRDPSTPEAPAAGGHVVRERGWMPPPSEAEDWLRSVRLRQVQDRRRLLAIMSKYLERRHAWRGTLSRHGRTLKRVERVAFDTYPRVLGKKDSPRGYDAMVQILVDVSGSMEPYLPACREAVVLVGDVLRTLGVSFAVTAYWEDDAPTGRGGTETILWDVVPYTHSRDPAAMAALFALRPELDNRDGAAIRHVAKRLERASEASKWILVVSDARPAAEGYEGGYEDTRRAVAEARARGIQVMHLIVAGDPDAALADAVRYLYGHAFAIARSPKDVSTAMERALKRVLRGLAGDVT